MVRCRPSRAGPEGQGRKQGGVAVVMGGPGVLLGKGTGKFNAPALTEATSLATADFNLDGNLDVVMRTQQDVMEVRLGDGKGAFGSGTEIPDSRNEQTVAAGDVTGDGKLDLLTLRSSTQGSRVRLLVGNGDGTFQALGGLPVELGVRTMMMADLDEDRRLGLVTADFNNSPRAALRPPSTDYSGRRPPAFWGEVNGTRLVAAEIPLRSSFAHIS